MAVQEPTPDQLAQPSKEDSFSSTLSIKDRLFRAIKAGDIRTISQVTVTPELQLGPDQLTPLHIACQHGQTKTVQFLLTEYGYNIKSCSKAGQTPLHVAAQNGHVEIMRILHESWNQQGKVSLEEKHVFESGHITFIDCSQSQSSNKGKSQKSDDKLPLPIVQWTKLATDSEKSQTSSPQPKTVKSSPSTQFGLEIDSNGNTPLHLAASHNHLEVAQYLLHKVKCSPYLTDNEGRNPLHLAAKYGNVDILKLLVEAVKMEREMYSCAIIRKHPADSEQAMISLSPPVAPPGWNPSLAVIMAAGDCNGDTLLHLATAHGHLKAVQYLLYQVKYSPYLTNSEGNASLHLAAKHGHFEVLKLLVKMIRDDEKKPESARTTKQHRQKTDTSRFFVCSSECPVLVTASPSTEAPPPTVVQSCIEANGGQSDSKQQQTEHLEDPYPASISSGNFNGDTPLHLAAAHNHLAVVKYLLHEVKCSPYLTNNEGQTALHLAAKHGHIKLLKYIIEETQCPLMPTDDYGQTPLYLAAGNGQLDVVKYFTLEKQCDVNFVTSSKETFPFSSGRTPLHIASREGNLDVVEFLVEKLKLNPRCADAEGTSPLHLACQQGHIAVVKYFVENQKMSPTISRLDGCTPLHMAALGGHADIVKYLKNSKCSPLCTDKYGNTPLYWAKLKGSSDVVKLFESQSSPKVEEDEKEPLYNANIHVVKYLIQEELIDFSPEDGKGTNPLHIASKNGDLDLVRYLVNKKKCIPICKDKDGNTPLHCAALGGWLNIVKYFITEKHCCPVEKGKEGRTAVHFASHEGHLEIVKYLVEEHHVDASCPDDRGSTPLHVASKNYHLELVKYFVEEKKCSPMYKNKDGDTSIHYAALGGNMSVVEYFITEKKCNVMEEENEGKTPLHKACSSGHLSVVKYLVDEEQADPFSLDDKGITPLHEACMSGHLNVIKYLIEEKQCDALLVKSNLISKSVQLQVSIEEVQLKTVLKELTLKCPRTPLHCASAESHLDVVKYLINDLQINPSYPDEDGATPLHMASANGCTEMVKYLVEEKHCDPMLRNKKGNNSLNMAAGNGHLNIFKYLVEQKHCNPMEGGWIGRTPLHFASQEGHIDIVIYLVEEGIFNPSTPDEQGITPLHLASVSDRLDVVKFFVERKQLKPSNFKDSSGNTPISMAVLTGSWNVVLYFATKEYCSSMVKDTKGCTALHYFSMRGCLNSVKQLVDELQADASCPDNAGVTPLHVASENGHLTIVRYLVEEKQCDLHSRDSGGHTPLSRAILNKDNLDVVKYFIEKQCDVTERDHSGRTLLQNASERGHINVVKCLLKSNPSTLDNKGITALHLAAEKGHLDVVCHLVKEFNCDPRYCRGFGFNPHKIAAIKGQWDIVIFFATEKKCDSNVVDAEGRTALHHYTEENKLELVKKIVDELQGDPSIPDKDGIVPLHVASIKGNLEIVRYLVEERQCDPMLKTKSGITLLNFAALNGHLNIVQYLINEKYCNLTEKGWQGRRTPLHDASQGGHLSIVRYLVEEGGVDPLSTDFKNATALHYASRHGHLQVVQYLIEKHCDPMHEDQDGNNPMKIAVSKKRWSVVMYFVKVGYFSPNERSLVVAMFHKACLDGRLDVMKCLVDHLQADPSIPDDDGDTPLHIASAKGHLAMVKYLLECKCDPQYKNNTGNTPMNCAALEGHLNILQFLITEKNHSPVARDFNGRTLLHNASQEGHLHIVKYLVNMRLVDPSCEDNAGLTPLHLACTEGHMGVVKYLVSQTFCDPSISQPSSPSPTELAFEHGNTEIGVYLLGKCTMAPKSNELLKAVLKEYPVLSPSVQVYIIGKRSSGKSTLTKAIQDEDSQMTGRWFSVRGVTAETAGVDPIQFDSKICGKITIYDFAGHEEYHGSHEALFENTSHPVFLIAVDLRLPNKEILKIIKYWMTLASKGITHAQSQADIILVGSHADVLRSRELQAKRDLLAEFVRSSSKLKFANVQCVGWVDLDCRKSASAGMTKLRQLLQQCCRFARYRADYNNTNAFLLKKYLSESYVNRRKACTFSQLIDALLQDETERFNTLKHLTRLCEACESLNTSGDIIFLKSQENMEDSWIILDKEHILSHVQGILRKVKSLTTTGIVPWSLLCKTTQDTNTSLVVEYMLKMEFCSEIEHQSLKQIKGANEPKEDDRYFFFPDLTKEKAPKDVWQEDSRFTYKFGWILKCSESDCTNFFTPRFLQVLLVRLTCRFALTSHPDSPVRVRPSKGCTIWMKGIRWKDPNLLGEILVELIEQNTAVAVLMKCMHTTTTTINKEMQFLKLRSSLIQEIISIKSKHCSNLNTTQFLIHPELVQQYPLRSVSGLPLSDVASAIVNKQPSIVEPSGEFLLLSDLLLFDPFQNFGAELLQELSSSYQHSREVKVPESTLRSISMAGEHSWEKLAEILEIGQDLVSKLRMDTTVHKTKIQKCQSVLDHWSSRKGTYSQLYEQLSSYSIFTGMVCNV